MPGVKTGSLCIAMTTLETKPRCCVPGEIAKSEISEFSDTISSTGDFSAEIIALAGGWFRMGADSFPHPEDGEMPERDVFIDGFSLAATTVTVDAFDDFVRATGYKTLAERVGTSFVFYKQCNSHEDYPAPVQAPWWRQVPGACWHAPTGLNGCNNTDGHFPATHIARDDAMAYCHWSRTRLPTEAEWEYAARGPLLSKPYPWGEHLEPNGIHHANIWQGHFPTHNSCLDGYGGVAPADAYGPKGFGHFNMIGNVWEWVVDRFTHQHSPRAVRNPKGPLNGASFVVKGGSYLCHSSYCERYRTSSRQALPANTTAGNIGFRVATDEC